MLPIQYFHQFQTFERYDTHLTEQWVRKEGVVWQVRRYHDAKQTIEIDRRTKEDLLNWLATHHTEHQFTAFTEAKPVPYISSTL